MKLRGFLQKLAFFLVLSFAWDLFTHAVFAISGKCSIKTTQSGRSLIPMIEDRFWHPTTGALRKIRDGLTLTVDRRIALFSGKNTPPLQIFGRCKLAYDLWTETFLVGDTLNQVEPSLKFANAKGVDALLKCVSIPLPNLDYAMAKVQILINPVDEEQEARTRNWLASKGIGGAGTGVMGRAMGAVINLKTESTVEYDCTK